MRRCTIFFVLAFLILVTMLFCGCGVNLGGNKDTNVWKITTCEGVFWGEAEITGNGAVIQVRNQVGRYDLPMESVIKIERVRASGNAEK